MYIYISYMRSIVPTAGIKARDKKLYPADNMRCNYLSLRLMQASGTAVLYPLLLTWINFNPSMDKWLHAQ